MEKETYLAAFLESSVGRKFGEELCRDLFFAGELRHWPADAFVFQEGDPEPGMHLVLAGLVKMTRFTEEGREVILHLVEPNHIFAEAAMFLGRYPASAMTVRESVTLLVRRDRVFELMDRHPAFLQRLFGSMAVWLKRMVDKIDQLTLNDATARVVRYLLDLSRSQGEGKEGSARVSLPVRKGELAHMLNINQATLSRTFRRLQDERVIDVEGGTIDLLDRGALQRLSLPPLE